MSTWRAFVAQLAVSAVLTLLIKAGVALSGHSVAWLLAVAIAVTVVFGGVLIVDNDDVWFI